jgi:tyrosinase
MSVPSSAALDPIFWLHHANIDRLWAVWTLNPPTHQDPSDPKWVNGPASIGEHPFEMPMPDGTTYTYTPEMVRDLSSLGYTYDDLSSTAVSAPAARAQAGAVGLDAGSEGAAAVGKPGEVELVGASEPSISIRGPETSTAVRFDAAAREKVAASFSGAIQSDAGRSASPDRVLLNLENVRGRNDATRFQVYVGVPDGASVDQYPNRRAGGIGLFGVTEASDPDGEHAGQGLSFVLDITRIVADMGLENAIDADALPVRIVSTHPVSEDEQLSIGRVSIFRQAT